MRRDKRDRGARPAPGRSFATALALAALSGAAALAHELLWTRRLIDLLGASAESTARVFGCFFLGLALGSAWASRLVPRVVRPWRAAALAEAAVAALALPALALPDLTGWVWPALGVELLLGPAGAAAKLLISVLVILPPAVAMGTALPFLAAAALTGSGRLDRREIGLYAANTLGGVAGLAATAAVALPALGAYGSMVLAMALNAAVAAGLAWQDRRSAATMPAQVSDSTTSPPTSATAFARILPGAVAFASGVGILAMEVLAIELVMLVAPLSFYAPAALLATVILLLGVAALLVPAALARLGGAAVLLPRVLAATAIAVAATPLLFMRIASATGSPVGASDLAGFLARLVGLMLVSVGPAVLLAGLALPATLAWAGGEVPARRAQQLGRLLALNGLGGFLGAEGAYRFILPAFGIHGGLAVVGLFYGLVALGLTWALRRDEAAGQAAPLMLPASAIVIVVSLAFGWVRDLPHVNPHLGFSVIDQSFGREGAVAVIQNERIGRAILLSNQYTLGSTSARWDQERQAHLPLLLHPEPRSVAFVGLATGITPGAALDHGPVRSVTAIELSPLVARAADRFFGGFNHAVTHDGRARVVVEDGRTYLAASPGRFDVVVGDLFLPWAPGEGRLFSVEHFRAVRRSLRPGGVFCQWLPMYQLTPDHFELIAESFRRAFPRVHLLRGGFGVRHPMLGLVGFRDGDLDWDVVTRRCEEARSHGAVVDPVARHPEAIRMLYLGPCPPRPDAGPVNTLGNMRLELEASRERVTGNPGRKYVYGERWSRMIWHLLTSTRARPGPGADDETGPPRLAGLMQLGFRLSLWEGARLGDGSGSTPPRSDLPADLLRQLPEALRADRGADWARWPGTPPRPREAPGPGDSPGSPPSVTGRADTARPSLRRRGRGRPVGRLAGRTSESRGRKAGEPTGGLSE